MTRDEMQAAFKTALGKGWDVFPDEFGDPQKPTLLILRTRLAKLPEAPRDHRLVTNVLWVILPQHATEDELDDALDDALAVLEGTLEVKWETAERIAYAENYPAFQVTLTSALQRPSI